MNTFELFLPSNEKSLFSATLPIVHENSRLIRNTFSHLDARSVMLNVFFALPLL